MTQPEGLHAVHRPPRVLFVSPNAAVGGSEIYLERLLARLNAPMIAGVAVLADGPAEAFFAGRGWPVEVLPVPARIGILRASFALRRVCRRLHADVVHANGVKAALVAVLALRRENVPVVWVKHDFSWDGLLVRWVARRCDVVVGVSAAVTACVPAGIDVRTMPNGVPALDVDRPEARQLLAQVANIPIGADVVLVVGRLDSGKGQLSLIDALPEVLRQRPQTVAVFIGPASTHEPRYGERMMARARVLGVEASVRIVGPRDDAMVLMAGADVLAVTSRPYTRRGTGEGFGLVAAEAMAVGTPVVAADHGGLREVVGGAGLLVRHDDHDALAGAVSRLLSDPCLASRFAKLGRERAANLDLDGLAAQMSALFIELADCNAQPPALRTDGSAS